MPEVTVRCADAIKNWTELAGAACMVIDSTRTGAGIHIQTFFPIRYFNSADEYGAGRCTGRAVRPGGRFDPQTGNRGCPGLA